jgi:type VI secretion system protein ImpH
MAMADRQTTTDLADVLLADAKNRDFFGLVEQLHGLHGDDMESSDAAEPGYQRVRLTSYAGLGFPASDISFAERMPAGSRSDYRVQATFFGLHGPDSPLPSYYLDRLAYEYGHGVGIRPAFLDFFNHRLLTLLHQAWRKYRYYVRFQLEARDKFSRYIFALVGLNDSDLRGATPLPWGRLLSYAGMIASRSRSPSVVAGIIAHCFDLETVSIREFEPRYMHVPEAQLLSLGKRNGVLGDSFVLGSRVQTRHSKFTIVIPNLDQARFREFLPSGENFGRLCKLIDFLMRDPSAYDLELGLRQEEVPPFNLGRDSGSHLGWTSFVDQTGLRTQANVRIKVRQ